MMKYVLTAKFLLLLQPHRPLEPFFYLLELDAVLSLGRSSGEEPR